MKKLLIYSLSTILLFSLSACKSTNLKSETANSSFTDVEDTSDVEKILAEANKRLAEEKEKRLEEKKNRVQKLASLTFIKNKKNFNTYKKRNRIGKPNIQ